MVDRTQAPSTRPFGHLNLPIPASRRLINGMSLMHYSGGDQSICRLTIKIPIGSEYIGKAAPSILAPLLAEGTKTYSPERFAELLDFNGASVNAHVSEYFVTLTFNMLTDKLPEVMPLVVSALSEPLFDESHLENARLTAANNLLTSRRNPAVVASDALKPLVYGEGHPLSEIMQVDDILAVTRRELQTLFEMMLNPAHIHAFISGKLSQHLVDRAADYLGAIPSLGTGFNVPQLEMRPLSEAKRLVTPFPDSMQSAVVMAIPAPPRSHPDFIPLRLAVIALGGYFGSRLMSNIREEKGLTYGIDASLQGLREGSFVSISAKCDKRFTEEVVGETFAELQRLASDPPSGTELENIRLYAMTSLAKTLDTPMSIMGYYGGKLEVGYTDGYFDAQQQTIARLSPDMIAAMASCYLRPNRTITSIAGE